MVRQVPTEGQPVTRAAEAFEFPRPGRRCGEAGGLAALVPDPLRRSAHHSVTELEADIRQWISERNKNSRRFVWAKTADEILDTVAT